MALSATLVWEIRPTNGTANAGGGFDPSVASPGTDYSQQDAVQVAYTDLVIDAVTNTDVTSAATAFTSAHVGNNIAITGGTGFTTGIYNVRSVSGVIATLDRAVGTTSSTGGTGNLGGARSGFAAGTTTLQSSIVSGNKVWVKNEAWNEAVSLTVAGAAGSPVIIEGYNTARGDIALGDGNANNPTNDRNSAAGDAITIGASNYEIRNINPREAGDAGFAVSGTFTPKFVNCKSSNNTGEGIEAGNSQTATVVGCELSNNGAGGASSAAGFYGWGNYIHDNTGAGVASAANNTAHNFSIFESNSSHGINATAPAQFQLNNNTFYNNTGASTDGLLLTTPVNISQMMNNIFSTNGRYGANATDGDSLFADYNCYYNNGTAARNNVPVGPNDVTSDPQFTNAASGDFSVGTNMKAIGFPGVFPGATSTGYLDLGAVQRQEPASGGGTPSWAS